VQTFCSRCEYEEKGVDCELCGRRKNSFWQDPVAELLLYLTEPHPWGNKIVAIAYNANVLHLHFILNRAIMLNWKPEMIMKGLKIMCTKMEHLVFLGSVSFLPCPLRKLPYAFGQNALKSWYLTISILRKT